MEMNEDGVSVKGCAYIYAPRGQAGEYAPLATNMYRGCGHKCVYCYVPAVLRMDRKEFDNSCTNRPSYIAGLAKDAAKYRHFGVREQVMLSFTTDPFNPINTSLTGQAIDVLKQNGLAFCTLTKGGSRALPFLEMFRPERDSFASTLTTLDDAFSKRWESGAALPQDRIDTLKAFYGAGIFTWASLEPTLSTESSTEIIKATHEFVGHYKIGRANYLPMTNTTDWEKYTHDIISLCQSLGVSHYIKKDLQKYLPEGYYNPLRVRQNNGSKDSVSAPSIYGELF